MTNYELGFGSRRVRACVSAILGLTAMGGYSVQTLAADEDQLEEVQVTGSRILRRDLESNSPLTTIDSAALESRSGLNIESYLNQLPSYNPAAAPNVEATNQDVQISAINSVGISSISLRGFGPNRSLVLIDGRRAVPTNALMVVDINGIPSSMIKKVEIITGGASATYGADAIGGVSNFLLRRDFQGLEVDAQWGTAQAGDNDTARASAIMGTSFSEGRGNIVMATEYYDRHAAFDKNRDFYTDGYADPTVPGNFLGFIFGANGYNFAPPGGAPVTGCSATSCVNPAANYYPNVGTLATILGRTVTGIPGNSNGVVGFGQPGRLYQPTGPFAAGGTGGIRFNPNGTIFDPTGNNRNSWSGAAIDNYRYGLVNAYDGSLCNSSNVAACATGPTQIQNLKYNETEGYTSNPQTRYSFMASGTYDISDSLTFSTSARYAQSRTRTFLAGTNASFGWEVSVPYNPTTDSPVNPSLDYTNQAIVAQVLANPGAFANPGFIAHGTAGAQHPVPVQMAILLNSRPAAGRSAAWVAETYPLNSFGRRATNNVADVWQIETSLNYKLPIKDWTAEVYYSRGETSQYNVAYGNNSLARWRAEVTAPDYGRNSRLQSNLTNNGPGASPAFGSNAVPCTSGFYETLFNGDAVPSADCQYAVQAALQTRTENQQDIGELNLQGGLFNLPAGEVRGAAGYQYRRNSGQFNPDILQSTASSTDQVIGVYPTGYLNNSTTAKDIYAELLIPILGDLPFLKKLELEVGGRHSEYDKTDSTNTYKINANIMVNDYLRFRGGYNRATRAPNLGELFLPLQQIFTGAGVYGDPCGVASNSPFGAGGAAPNPIAGQPSQLAGGQTAAGANSAYLICRAQMGAAGATAFYSGAQPAAGGGGFAWVNQIGNPNLDSEKADTWTAGVVFKSPFEHVLLSNITATIDWYKVEINDAILPYSIDYARFLCYGAVTVTDAAGAAAQAATTSCTNLPRNTANGNAVTTLVSFDNQAVVSTSGIDFTLDWRAQLADMGMASLPGSFGVNFTGTVLDYYKTKQSPANYDPQIDWKGSLGPNLQGFQGGSYDYRLITSFSYNLASVGANLRWRHYPKVDIAAIAQENAIKRNNAAVAAGSGGTLLSYTPSTAQQVASYDVLDLSAYWNISDTITLRLGVDNLLDRGPASTTITKGRPYDYGMTPAQNSAVLSAVCGSPVAPGCVNPTSYSIGNDGAGGTSGGYYDVLGRQFFIALKARF
ncbi:MAG: TonB-dependent receptor [Pseudomonadota bacterium]